jgi:nucleoside-diphosphate-sugar epimerase
VDFVYHMASPASPIDYLRLPLLTLKVGSHGTHHTLGLAKKHRARFLIASTSEVYGDPKEHPQVEPYWGHVNPIGPRACYDEGKRCAETLTVSYASQYGVRTRIARIFNTYGPRMHEHDGRVVSNFVLQALRGEPITIYGQGDQTRSFCYVSDLLEGFVRLLATQEDPGPVNIGNPSERTIKELGQLILKMTGSSSQLHYEDLPVDDPTRRCPDITRAKQVLGWEPRVSIEEGLKHTIAYFREYVKRA